MFDVPGFNPSAMSDDELLNRQAELSRRLGWASRFSGSDMSHQLYAMINAIEAERRDRILRVMFSERNKMFPEVIETEPDLAAEHKRKVVKSEDDDAMAHRRRVGRERLALTKTSAPSPQQPQFTPVERAPEDTLKKSATPQEDNLPGPEVQPEPKKKK